MSKAVVSYANLIDAAAALLTLPFETAEAEHPISNLKLRGLGEYLQVTAPESLLIVDIDFGSVKTFNFVAGLGYGLDSPAGAGEMGIAVETSATGSDPWVTQSNTYVEDNAPLYMPGASYAVMPAGVSSRYVRVSVYWPSSSPKRLARLWVSNALIIENKVESGTDFGFVDLSELSQTDGEQYVERLKLRTKSVPITFRNLTTLEAWGFSDGDALAADVPSINGMQFVAGITGEVIVLPIAITDTPASDTLWQRRTGVYGHIVSPYSIQRDMNSEAWTVSFTMKEER